MHSVHRLSLQLLALLLIALSLPGSGAELQLCLGPDGHIGLAAHAEHACRSDEPRPSRCHLDLQPLHSSCVDLVLCAPDLAWGSGAHQRSLVPQTPVAQVPLSCVAALQRAPTIVRHAEPGDPRLPALLQHLRTVVLLI